MEIYELKNSEIKTEDNVEAGERKYAAGKSTWNKMVTNLEPNEMEEISFN